MTITNYEKLGAFYLGREFNPQSGERSNHPVLYDAKDLTTHALIIGMTGSGKTGLAVSLIEEAIIDGIPVLAIDPKGDLGNLFLSFPQLKDKDFAPWIDPVSASHKGLTPGQFATNTAKLWQSGLAEWGQDKQRIKKYIDAADRCLYTPGSRSGTPLSLLSTLSLPAEDILDDEEALRDRIQAAVSGLLALLGIDGDPMTSREHILLSLLLDRSWRQGSSLDLAALIMQIQKPPVERIGVLELESFYPTKDRAAFAIRINSLLASPGFAAWMEGEPLDAASLLYTREGKPRLSVVSISHLSDNERMFVVTCILQSLINWMRSQPGSGSLRAIVYMDEIFGYLPPVANPPSKQPLLTLLKQARAFGVGLTLATQNPVDLDYKALANAGTWFLGRLQTERDKKRVIDGLEGAANSEMNRSDLEALLGRLEGRQFLLHNVHEDKPVIFETRWVLNYLAGPLTRKQIKQIAAQQQDQSKPDASPAPPVSLKSSLTQSQVSAVKANDHQGLQSLRTSPPKVHDNLPQGYAALNCQPTSAQSLVYRPFLFAVVNLHYCQSRLKVDVWHRLYYLASLDDNAQPWRAADAIDRPEIADQAHENASYAKTPKAAATASGVKRWHSQLKTILYQSRKLERFSSKNPKALSESLESIADFKSRLLSLKREQRDMQVEKLRQKYAPKLHRLQEQIFTAEQRLIKEKQQVQDKQIDAGLSFGATLVGALFGRKLASSRNVSRASRAVRGARRISKEKQDVVQVQEKLDTLRARLEDLELQFEQELADLQQPLSFEDLVVTTKAISCRKSDTDIEEMMLLWVPYLTEPNDPQGALAASIIDKQAVQ